MPEEPKSQQPEQPNPDTATNIKSSKKKREVPDEPFKKVKRVKTKPDDVADIAISDARPEYVIENGLRKVPPYWYVHKTHAKGRWVGRKILEVFTTEFQDQNAEYYVRVIHDIHPQSRVMHDYVIKNGDLVCHAVHRHEPPISAAPIKIVYQGDDLLVIDKPGSIPIHPTGRYHYNTLTGMLTGPEFGFKEVYPANRIDRLTSGIVLLGLTKDRANQLTQEMVARDVGKVYLCRVKGEFPEDPVVCEEPLLTASQKLGINMVSEKGKPSKTCFKRLSFNGITSLVECQPLTGRTHQIRVHLQYLGFPIANDPLYCSDAWGPKCGKGGVTDEEAAEVLVKIKAATFPHSSATTGTTPATIETKLDSSSAVPVSSAETKPEQNSDSSSNDKKETLVPTAIQGEFMKAESFLCPECLITRSDPITEQLQIYLHSWKYNGNGWRFETELPRWALDDFYDDKMLESMFWSNGGRWKTEADILDE
ncbi:RNA pseudouridylate synthase domain containing protein 2 [Blyttiomyces sp. JEL0837]|nr:RNA pseudouridylate synthase domain containing protein 2 [Blyttiomyces sp. JEL0837]